MANSFCGSLAYLAPEMLKRTGHGKAVDWYHLGVLLYEMLTGDPPFISENKYIPSCFIENFLSLFFSFYKSLLIFILYLFFFKKSNLEMK